MAFQVKAMGEPMALRYQTMGGAHDIPSKDHGGNPWKLHVCCMIFYDHMLCGIFRELTKLYAYGFQFMFQVLRFSNGRAQDDCKAHTTCFRILCITLI